MLRELISQLRVIAVPSKDYIPPETNKEANGKVIPMKKLNVVENIQQQRQNEQPSEIVMDELEVNNLGLNHILLLFLEKCVQKLDQLNQVLAKLNAEKVAAKQHNIHHKESQETPEQELLSVQEQGIVRIVLELIINWGILPFLPEGVGVKGEKRSSIIKIGYDLSINTSTISQEEAQQILFKSTMGIYSLLNAPHTSQESSQVSELYPIVVSRHLMDLFAGCLALIHTPERNLSPSDLLKLENNNKSPPIPRDKVSQVLNQLVDESPLDFVMEALLRLMNIATETSARLQKQQTTSKELEASKRTLSNLLSRCIRKKDGVSLILQMLLKDQAKNNKEKKKQTLTEVLRGTVLIIGKLLEKDPQIAHSMVLSKIGRPLLCYTYQLIPASSAYSMVLENLPHTIAIWLDVEKESINVKDAYENDFGVVVCSETQVKECLEQFHLVIMNNPPSSTILDEFVLYMLPLFDLYCQAVRSKSTLQNTARQMIISFFRLSDLAIPVIKAIIQQTSPSIFFPSASTQQQDSKPLYRYHVLNGQHQAMKEDLCLVWGSGPTGGITLRLMPKSKYQTIDVTTKGDFLLFILKELNKSFLSNLFIQLLQQFTTMQTTAPSGSSLEEAVENFQSTQNSRLMTLHILAVMCEQCGEGLVENVTQFCVLVKILLERKDDHEIITLALGLLSVLLNGSVKIRQEEEILLTDMVDDLTSLKDPNVYSTQITESAEQILKLIEDKENAKWTEGLIDAQCLSHYEESVPTTEETQLQPPSVDERDIKELLKQLNDPLVSVRAQALVKLRKWVLMKEPFTLKNLNRIIKVFTDSLVDEDTYGWMLLCFKLCRFIYLNGVKGLNALGDLYPDIIIPILMKYYVEGFDKTAQPTPKEPLIGEEVLMTKDEMVRLKIGEALLQIAKRCGKVLPKYAPHFMNGFLAGCKDPLMSIRASSLSNLAEMAKQLHFALHSYIVDIIECVVSILNTEKEPFVRRVLGLLFRGLGMDVLSMIPTQLKNLYSLIRRIASSDPDSLTQLHAQQALMQIDQIVAQLFLQ